MSILQNPPPGSAPESGYKYWAFMSYSHQDEAWAAWVHNALETYRVPRSLVGRTSTDGGVSRQVFPIFRDRDKLPGAADLGAKIHEALRQSRYLIVICSPRAAASTWVNEEVKQFKALGREDRVLCLIVDGEPNASDQSDHRLQECFPPAVRFRANERGELTATRTEPLAADARKGKDGKVNAKLKLLAGLLAVGYDELRQREKQRQRWQRVRQGTGATLVVLAGALMYLGLADAGLPVPAAEGLRTFLDRHEVSVLRPVHSDMEVRQAAARMRRALIGRLVTTWTRTRWETDQTLPTGPGKSPDIWTVSRAAYAVLHAAEPLGTEVENIRHMLQAPFEPGIAIESGGVKYGWRPGYHAYPLAQPALWTVAAFATALKRAEFHTTDRTELERHLAYAQEATRPYYPTRIGGWQIVPHVIAPDGESTEEHPNTYITALALLALLETRAAGLP